MNPYDEINKLTRHVAGLQTEQAAFLAKREDELKDLIERGAPAEKIEKHKQGMEGYKVSVDEMIQRANGRVTALKEQLISERKAEIEQAQARIEGMREKAFTAWISSGGDPAKFDSRWESIKDDLLEQEVKSKLSEPKRPSTRIAF